MKWTKEQQQAIDLRNKNILVAAAAGSGKTAVLVERIKNLILQDKCPVDRMLIVTFTNAAAAEMKEKIQRAINDAIEDIIENDGPKEQVYFLKKQLNLLPSANISTFHSFALDVIRRYFYLIQIEPNFRICDTTEETLLKGEAMDQLLEELFEQDEPEFYHFLKCYSGDRNENKFRELIDNSYTTIGSLPEPFEWLDDSVAQLKDGKAVKDVNQLMRDVGGLQAGTTAKIGVIRGGKRIPDITVKIEARAKDIDSQSGKFWPGFLVTVLDDDMKKQLNIDDKKLKGVVVTNVEERSPAAALRIQNGDVITGVNGVAVSNLAEFYLELSKVDKSINFDIYSNGGTITTGTYKF